METGHLAEMYDPGLVKDAVASHLWNVLPGHPGSAGMVATFAGLLRLRQLKDRTVDVINNTNQFPSLVGNPGAFFGGGERCQRLTAYYAKFATYRISVRVDM